MLAQVQDLLILHRFEMPTQAVYNATLSPSVSPLHGEEGNISSVIWKFTFEFPTLQKYTFKGITCFADIYTPP